MQVLVYVIQSEYINNAAVSNNTAIKHLCRTCHLAFYCYSNSTVTSSSALITFPNNEVVSDRSASYYNRLSVQRVAPSGITLTYTYYYNDYNRLTSGIYTCKIPDSLGIPIELSIGLYFQEVGKIRRLC